MYMYPYIYIYIYIPIYMYIYIYIYIHIERERVHSGDASLMLPPQTLAAADMAKVDIDTDIYIGIDRYV